MLTVLAAVCAANPRGECYVVGGVGAGHPEDVAGAVDIAIAYDMGIIHGALVPENKCGNLPTLAVSVFRTRRSKSSL